MATKAEHHEAVRAFVKKLTPPLKLSLAALETLAVIAYKQPVTAPEIMEIRGVQGAGVLKTLLDRKLIAEAGRKNVVGKPILYKTTKEFLVQFGLKDLSELPTLKEFEELGRMEIGGTETASRRPSRRRTRPKRHRRKMPEERLQKDPLAGRRRQPPQSRGVDRRRPRDGERRRPSPSSAPRPISSATTSRSTAACCARPSVTSISR